MRGLEFDETARASQALRGFRGEEPNIGEDFLRDLQRKMSLSNQNNQVGDFIKDHFLEIMRRKSNDY